MSWSDLTPAGFLSVRTIRSDSSVHELGSLWRAWQSRSCMNRAFCGGVGSRGGPVAKQSRSCINRTPIILMWVQLFSPMCFFFTRREELWAAKRWVPSQNQHTHPRCWFLVHIISVSIRAAFWSSNIEKLCLPFNLHYRWVVLIVCLYAYHICISLKGLVTHLFKICMVLLAVWILSWLKQAKIKAVWRRG